MWSTIHCDNDNNILLSKNLKKESEDFFNWRLLINLEKHSTQMNGYKCSIILCLQKCLIYTDYFIRSLVLNVFLYYTMY